jgi:hypothetical protein
VLGDTELEPPALRFEPFPATSTTTMVSRTRAYLFNTATYAVFVADIGVAIATWYAER